MKTMKTYKIKLKLDETETEVIEIEAKDWEEVCNYVFGNIQVIDTEEEL